jgi:hypothetical protein
VTDVRRPEEALRVGLDEHLLDAALGRAPDREASVAVLVVQHHEERSLVADEECRMPVAEALARLGKLETELPDPRQGLLLVDHTFR